MKEYYSKYLEHPSSFITSYEITEEEILIYTKGTKKKEPLVYPKTKENIKMIEEKLKKQYELIIDNKDTIIETMFKAKTNSLKFALLMLILSILTIVFNLNLFFGAALLATSILTAIGGTIKEELSKIKLCQEIETYQRFLNKRKDIETTSKTDENIIRYISNETLTRITDNESLQKDGYIEEVFNIDFMDKTSLKDLRELLLRYKIVQGIKAEPTFADPEKKSAKLRKKERY